MNTMAIINIARAELGLDEDAYRALLARVTGKDSLRAMSDAERRRVIDELKRQGFRIRVAKRALPLSHKPYIRKIHALWKSCAGLGVVQDGSRSALRAFCKNRLAPEAGNVAIDPDMLTYQQAAPIIEALKKMEARGKARAEMG